MTQTTQETGFTGPCRHYEAGAWELYGFFRQRRTRSEGQFGVLLKDGEMVAPAELNEERETDLGRMKYYGPTPEMLWEPSGWHFADKSRIQPSWED